MGLREDDEEAGAHAVAPRVTLAHMEAEIAQTIYLTGADAALAAPQAEQVSAEDLEALECLTICLLVLRSGYTVIGKSAPAAPENYLPDVGRKFAREDAVRQLWPLFGFYLKQKLADGEPWPPSPVPEPADKPVKGVDIDDDTPF